MRWRTALAALLWLAALCFGFLLVLAAFNIRSPALLAWRPWPIVVLGATATIFIVGVAAASRHSAKLLRVVALSLGVAGLALGVWREVRIMLLKSAVMAAPLEELRAVAAHLIVGYGAIAELEPLVARAGVGGVFIARRNARGRSESDIATDIRRLQDLRRANALPALWIATDQEGGMVSALSPPLRQPLPLSSLVHSGELVVNEAETVARDLACTGVNLNFAPVVDRNARVVIPGDRLSQISRRAISSDERIIALTARDYCRALASSGVQCTLKHFPGMGFVKSDPHVGAATLPGLDDAALYPFRELAREEPPWIMLGHVIVESLDAERPASASQKIIGLLRDDWDFNGILVTDDASMAAYAESFEMNAIATMRNGADFLLVSYDPDLVFAALDALLRARRTDAGLVNALAVSDARLAKHPPLAPSCSRLAWRSTSQAASR